MFESNESLSILIALFRESFAVFDDDLDIPRRTMEIVRFWTWIPVSVLLMISLLIHQTFYGDIVHALHSVYPSFEFDWLG
jgi:hypothetical protein